MLAPAGVAYRYRFIVNGWVWFLQRTVTTRVFHEKTAPEIIKAVLNGHGLGTVKDQLGSGYRTREYCVQYRETDYNFVTRLMENEGIYYYFEHENGAHHVVLCDKPGDHTPYRTFSTFSYGTADVAHAQEKVTAWQRISRVQSGKVTLNEFDFKNPRGDLVATASDSVTHKLSGYELYDHPGEYVVKDEGDRYAKVRMNEEAAQREVITASGNARGVHVGHRFTLEDHPRSNQNKTYYVHSTEIDLTNNLDVSNTASANYSVRFTALGEQVQFHLPRITPRPFVQGPVTAIVVGDDDVPTDEHGRVQVRFFWDRDHSASTAVWLRVSHAWAGGKYGFVGFPRSGTEVIVSFLEGNPDAPIITGRVYNPDSKHPFDPKNESSVSGIKTLTIGGGGYNELRFDDKAGAELIGFRAQKDWRSFIKESRFETLLKDQHLAVDGKLVEEIGGDANLTIKGDQNEAVTGGISLKGSTDIQFKSGTKFATDAGTEIHLKAGTNLVLEAATGLTLKVGSNFVTLNSGGVFIQGSMVMINSGGAALAGTGSKPATPASITRAEDGQAGENPPKKSPGTVTTYSPQAQSLILAAEQGAPFCAICNP